ncbi:MAG: ABC transporter permease [Lachnospiraceae bacterium]|nr:ABC transporter permease [Lachnospiraceae bacterium]
MDSLNAVVVLVIVCAALLAFIVLYNLTNINIIERVREIATLKVLGFYPNETSQYVFRENLLLTAVGTLVGLGLGVWLHRFVMVNVDVDIVSFDITILPVSYLLAVVLTFAFSLIVDFAMYFKLEKINMAESLKTIE